MESRSQVITEPRFSEAAFRRYEKTIAQIMTAYPRAVIIDPAPLSVTTFSCRLRDAIRGWQQHGYYTDQIPTMVPFPSPTIRVRGNTIIAGGYRETLPNGPDLDFASQPVVNPVKTVIDGSDAQAVAAVVCLLGKRIITGPFRVQTTSSSDEALLLQLSSENDVDITRVSDRLYELF